MELDDMQTQSSCTESDLHGSTPEQPQIKLFSSKYNWTSANQFTKKMYKQLQEEYFELYSWISTTFHEIQFPNVKQTNQSISHNW